MQIVRSCAVVLVLGLTLVCLNKKVVNESKTGPPIMAKNRKMAAFVRFENRGLKLLSACDMTNTRRCLPTERVETRCGRVWRSHGGPGRVCDR